MNMRTTYTGVEVPIDRHAYNRLRETLETNGYHHHLDGGCVDGHGFLFVPEMPRTPSVHSFTPGTIWKHHVRQTDYTIVGTATVQRGDLPLTDGDAVVVYLGHDGKLWVRPPDEFAGKFTRVEPDTPELERVPTLSWAIMHADGKRWRDLDEYGLPTWTENPFEALGFTAKRHADAFAAEDADDIRIVQILKG